MLPTAPELVSVTAGVLRSIFLRHSVSCDVAKQQSHTHAHTEEKRGGASDSAKGCVHHWNADHAVVVAAKDDIQESSLRMGHTPHVPRI